MFLHPVPIFVSMESSIQRKHHSPFFPSFLHYDIIYITAIDFSDDFIPSKGRKKGVGNSGGIIFRSFVPNIQDRLFLRDNRKVLHECFQLYVVMKRLHSLITFHDSPAKKIKGILAKSFNGQHFFFIFTLFLLTMQFQSFLEWNASSKQTTNIKLIFSVTEKTIIDA